MIFQGITRFLDIYFSKEREVIVARLPIGRFNLDLNNNTPYILDRRIVNGIELNVKCKGEIRV